LAALPIAPALMAYDDASAQRFATMFEPVQGMKAGKALHLIKPEQLVQRIKQGEQLVPLDVRTPMEPGIYGMTMPDTLAIPINTLFRPENLERIPTDMPVLVVCASGTRATAAATALRFIGFDNVYVLKGGIAALATHLNAKNANAPLPAP
jgi:rhodanese-related sulfurtransferase